MLPIEMRLKRMEVRHRNQRILNILLLGIAGFLLVQPGSFERIMGLFSRGQHAKPAMLAIHDTPPAPVMPQKMNEMDIEHLKTRRLSITDKFGRERMTLLVDMNDSPFVIVKDEEGHFRATLAVQMDGRGAVGLWNTEKQPVYGSIEPKAGAEQPKTGALQISQVKPD